MADDRLRKLVTRDPNGVPTVTPELAQRAEQLRLHIVNVICDEPGANVGGEGAVSFLALVAFLPRPGDRIEVENGRTCEVKRAYFKVARAQDQFGESDAFALVPTIYSVLLPR